MKSGRFAPPLLTGAVVAALSSMALSCGGDTGAEASPPVKPKPDTGVDAAPLEGGIDGGSNGGGGDASACAPKTCAQLGASCGSAPDGCGGVVHCGTCPIGQSCGGGGPNVCGDAPCTPKSCAEQSAECGTLDDGCAGTLYCGSCPATQLCMAYQCGCASGKFLCGAQCIAEGTCCTDADCSGLNVCSKPGSACACRTSPSRQAVYHSWKPSTGDHLFSPAIGEGSSAGYTGDSIAYYVYAAPCQWGLVPFHRLVRVSTSEHFCTADDAEKSSLVSQGWTLEGNVGCLSETPICGAVPLYRIATYEAKHMYTTDPSERDALVAEGGLAEGLAGYVWEGP